MKTTIGEMLPKPTHPPLPTQTLCVRISSKHLFTYSSEHKYMYNSSYNTTRLAWQKKGALLPNLPQFHPSGSCHWSEGQHVQGTVARHGVYPCWDGEAVGRGVDTHLFENLELQSLSNPSAWSKEIIEVDQQGFEERGKESDRKRDQTHS